MANETSALRNQPSPGRVVEHDFQTFCDAVGATTRGRAFLQEYAKRNRHADTEVVLAALARLESVARSQRSAPEAERIRQDLRALLGTIHSARPQIDSTPGAIKAATLAALMAFVQARIEGLLSPTTAPIAAVPEPEQRELPIPQPRQTAQRPIALVDAMLSRTDYVPAVSTETFARKPTAPPSTRNFDPDLPSNDAPRVSKILPAVDFIETLFEKASVKADTNATPATEGEQPAAAKTVASVPTLAPVELPVAATTPALGAVAFIEATETAALNEAVPHVEAAGDAETVGMEPAARPTSATAAAIDASAAAIDEIVAAAEAAMAQDAARTQPAANEPAFVEISTAKAEPAVSLSEPPAARAQLLIAAVDVAPIATAMAAIAAASEPAQTIAAEPTLPVADNALSPIMGLSEEERLALFT